MILKANFIWYNVSSNSQGTVPLLFSGLNKYSHLSPVLYQLVSASFKAVHILNINPSYMML